MQKKSTGSYAETLHHAGKFYFSKQFFVVSFTIVNLPRMVYFMDNNILKDTLTAKLSEKEDLIVSYSGGIDSTLLAVLAKKELSGDVRCILLDAPIVSRRAVREAVKTAEELGLSCEVVPFPIMENEKFKKNPSNRCYYCKKYSARFLKKHAQKLGISHIADGMNASDLQDYRPGFQASEEEGVLHPLLEAGLDKAQIRKISRECDIPIWNKPSSACLSSRFPYGEEITVEKLEMVENAEDFLQDLGFSQFRVRFHNRIARIELISEELEKAMSFRERIVEALEGYGFSYVTLDLKGFRSGSMNEVL